MSKYYIKTFGCQMNHSDSERIAGFLESLPPSNSPLEKEGGFILTKNINDADLVIFNTCGVRQMAEDRVYGQVHNIHEAWSKKHGAKNTHAIILTGCLANRPDVQKRLKNKVDLFFPINEFEKFENWIIKEFENSLKIVNCKLKIPACNKLTTNKNNVSYLSITPQYKNKFEAGVPIMTGCNNFCAYCVVPYARGREVSRPAEDIIEEVKDLVKKGYKHITLLGQNVNSYHGTWSMEHKTKEINFSQLIRKINAIPGKFWISFMSNHPKDVTDEMIETVTKCKKICENFHLPIQAGNDEILQKMNRKYTTRDYMKIMRKIKSAFKKNKPDSLYSVTCDIIVGFPGETRKKFNDSAEVMRKAKFDMVFFGRFSPRPGTAAWEMKDNVSKKEKERRENSLNEILKYTCAANNKKYIGKIVEVLIEKEKNGSYFGKTRTMKNVKIVLNFHSDKPSESTDLVGKIIRVKITKANIWNLEGILNSKS